MPARDRQRSTLRDPFGHGRTVHRDALTLAWSPRLAELLADLRHALELARVEASHTLERLGTLGGEDVRSGPPTLELAHRLEQVTEATAVEVALLPPPTTPLAIRLEELRVTLEDLLGPSVEPQIHDRALQVLREFVDLVLTLLPPCGDGSDRPLDADLRYGFPDRGPVALGAEQNDAAHVRDRTHRLAPAMNFVGGHPRTGDTAGFPEPPWEKPVMHVIFIEPAFPGYQRDFVRGLAAVGAKVSAVGEAPYEALDAELQGWLANYEQVPSVVHEASLLEAVRTIQRRGWVDRLETTVEAHVLPAARVRAACGIPGTTERTAFLCRDKPAMKDALRDAGVATAQSLGSADAAEIRAFAESVGFPVIVKPRKAAGAAGTYRADDAKQLDGILDEVGVGRGNDVAVEEFVEGHEGFYDTLCADGEVVHEFVSHYYPNVLHAMRNRWISPQIIATNRLGAGSYDEVRALGKTVVDALGIGTSATHMEWFFGPKGLKFSEIGCRPPGVNMWDLYAAANDFDIYREWAHLIVTGKPSQKRSLRFSTGMINLRPDRDGRITGYEGVEEIFERFGDHIFAHRLPPVGSVTAPIEGGYKVNAWMHVRHTSYDTLREILDTIGETVKVLAG